MSRGSCTETGEPPHFNEAAVLRSAGKAQAGSPHRHGLHAKGKSAVSYPLYTLIGALPGHFGSSTVLPTQSSAGP
ncbi:hypothetical protein [Sorangium sp. So ce363]|uniref:hypothetical protein n=1 Tax=Sorangium sp. So ce363 TaxID=3133304 RepID=UPI003F5EC3D4